MTQNLFDTLPAQQAKDLVDFATGGFLSGEPTGSPQDPRAQRNSALVALVQKKMAEGERAKWPIIKKAALNKEYYADNQLAAWNPQKRAVVRTPTVRGAAGASHRVFLNFFKPTMNAIIAHFLSTRAQLLVKPGAADERVIEAARMAQKVVAEYEWQRQGMQEIMATMLPHLMLDGTAILKVVWNPKAGKYLGKRPKPIIMDGAPVQATRLDPMSGAMVPLEENGRPVYLHKTGPDGKPIMEDQWEGGIETVVVPMRNFICDPTALSSFSRASWCAEKYRVSQNYCFKRWGVKVQAPSSSTDPENQYERSGFFGFNRRWDDQTSEYNTIDVVEMWFERGEYPLSNGDTLVSERGYMITIAGDTLIEKATGENPNDHGEFPYVFIPCLRLTDEIWGDTIANSLRILQNTMNKTASQITLANDLMGNPQWLLPNGCKMPDQDRTNKAGSYKRYEAGLGGEKPEMIPGIGVANGVWKYFDSVRMAFQEISGVREGGLAGGAPGSIESGKALNVLVQSDMGKLASIGTEIGMALERWGWLVMRLIKQHWTEKRLITVGGSMRVPEAFSFSGVDIHDSFQMAVVPESTLPQTMAMKQAKADNLFDRGLIKPYDYLRRLGEDTSEDFTIESLNISNARIENAWIRKYGVLRTTPEQMEIEMHDLHLEEHDRELLNPALRKDPAKWMALKEHRDMHAEMQRTAEDEEMSRAGAAAQALGPQGMPTANVSDIPAIPPVQIPPPGQ